MSAAPHLRVIDGGADVVPLFANERFPVAGDEILTKRELCARLKVSKTTVDKWRREEGLPCFKPYGDHQRATVRFVWRHVYAWLCARQAR